MTQTSELKKERPVFVVGHMNPDTDSICAAITYANLKTKATGRRHVPKRAGQLNLETKYVLETFGVETPLYMNDVHRQVKDMEINPLPPIRGCLSLKKAWERMKDSKVCTLPVCSEEGVLQGVITEGDIAESYMGMYASDVLSQAKTTYKNIVETLGGQLLVGEMTDVLEKGKILIAAANPDILETYIDPGDVVICGNRYESQLCAIQMGAGCVIVTGDVPVSQTIRRMAEEKGCHLISSPFETFNVARLVNQAISIDFFMNAGQMVSFNRSDKLEDIREVMTQNRNRDFPVVDHEGNYIGMISRRKLLGARKKQIILVDHNEVSQAVEGLDEAEILEIIDHHRIGSLETMGPVYFRNQPVGCTCTIVAMMYDELGVEIEPRMAGLMCSAIISDTLMFRSPTCTPVDKVICERLAKIAGIDVEEHAKAMFNAGSAFGSRTCEEIFYQDYKRFVMGDLQIGIGQLSSMDDRELMKVRDRLMPFAKGVHDKDNMDMLFLMFTDILAETTYLLCIGDGSKELAEKAFGAVRDDHCTVKLPGVVSRKKQLVPGLMATLQNEG